MNEYVTLGRVGGGGFGEVVRALHIPTGDIVALKKVRVAQEIPQGIFREIQALKRLQGHRNVVELKEVFASGSSICMTMELADMDLKSFLEECGALPEETTKYISFQIACGLHFCHTSGVLHRDLKPSNILIWKHSGKVKIADFGLARAGWTVASTEKKLSHQVATRWYRSPELLLGSKCYDGAVDMWALGVIILEMIQGAVVFPGENDIEQFYRIAQQLGSPSDEIFRDLPDAGKIEFPSFEPLTFQMYDTSSELSVVVSSLIQYDPKKRPNSEKIVSNPCFICHPLPQFLF